MGLNSKISWRNHTWNPWRGCNPVSEGCRNCYAEREMTRYGHKFSQVTRAAKATFELPLKKAVKAGDKVFTCSWGDFFHPAADNLRSATWEIIRRRPDVLFLVLTKRPERFKACLPASWAFKPWPNVALGVTAENQEMADLRLPLLLAMPAALRWVSIEPMIGPVDLRGIGKAGRGNDLDALAGWTTSYVGHKARGSEECSIGVTSINGHPCLDWVIVGGETGAAARPMHPDWARSVRDQCQAAGVPFHFKQWGEWWPCGKAIMENRRMVSMGKECFYQVGHEAAGRLLDGREHLDFPAWIPDERGMICGVLE
jgi:protein gp37